MTMIKTYMVAGHRFRVIGDRICETTSTMDGFEPFECADGNTLFDIVEGKDEPTLTDLQYTFKYEDVTGSFGRWSKGSILILKPAKEAVLTLWTEDGVKRVSVSGNLSVDLYHFAVWVGFGLMTIASDSVAIHSSCIVCNNKAVLFLGESGTGKSTHTALWQKYIPGAFLLNDDSPIIRIEDGKIWAYGSPWSGKTPCYKSERYPLAACVRLSQAPYNHIKKLSILQAYGAIHPSCPPEFAYDSTIYDHISRFISQLLTHIPVYHLACLPNEDAARLSYTSVMSTNDENTGK